MSPLKVIFATDEHVRLGWLAFAAFALSALAALVLIKRFFEIEWPFPLFPMTIALVWAAFCYGVNVGMQGRQCGLSEKSWKLARKMVAMGLYIVLALFLYQVIDVGAEVLITDLSVVVFFGAQIVVFALVSIVLCRFALTLGAKRGYAVFLKKENRSA